MFEKLHMKSKLSRRLWIAAGTFFVVIGAVGIILPLLPTTPFLLAAAACYSRGSERLYNWLLGNRWFGKFIKDYMEKRAIPLRAKVLAVCVIWLTIGVSVSLAVHSLPVKLVLVVIAAGITMYLLTRKTLKEWPYRC